MVCNFLVSLFKWKCCGCTPKVDDLDGIKDRIQDKVTPEQVVVHKSTTDKDKDAYHQNIPVKMVNPDVRIERKLSIISNGYGYYNKAFIGRGSVASVASIESFKSMTD